MVNDNGSNDSDTFGGVTIKQEKITPPSSPSSLSLKQLNNVSTTDQSASKSSDERKPITEPIRSSDEILADLFKVFNAAPPTLDDIDTKAKSKKAKKDKKSKKHKKDSHRDSASDGESRSSSDGKVRKVKKEKKDKKEKKAKKDKKRKRSKSDDDEKVVIKKEIGEVVVKNEPDDSHNKDISSERHSKDKSVERHSKDKTSDRHNSDKNNKDGQNVASTSKDTETTASYDAEPKNSQLGGIQVSLSKDSDGTTKTRKIVIKSLVNSEVFKETVKESERKEKEKIDKSREREERKARKRKHEHERNQRSEEKRSRHRSRSSSLSLSDEETYLREREREARKHQKVRLNTTDLRRLCMFTSYLIIFFLLFTQHRSGIASDMGSVIETEIEKLMISMAIIHSDVIDPTVIIIVVEGMNH